MGYYNNGEYQDAALKAHDITWLFRLAQDWLKTNPAEQIPLDTWASKVAEIPAPRDFPLAIIVADIGIHHISTDIIPALAALSLRLKPEAVAKILDHHGVDYHQMIKVRYEYDDLTAEQRKSTLKVDAQNLVLDSFTVAHGVIQALSSNPRQRAELIKQAMEYSCTASTSLAKLHADLPELWPITYIEEASKRLPFATSSDIPPSAKMDYANLWNGAQFVQLPDDFSNDDYIRLLDRSGALSRKANLENGYADQFFQRILLHAPGDSGAYNAQRFLDAINCEQRPEVIKHITQKVLSELKTCSMDGIGWTHRLNDALEKNCGQVYAPVLNSLAVRLSLLDLHPNSVTMLKLVYTDPNELLPNTQSKVSELLKDAAAEFMAIPLENLEHGDFRAIQRVLKLGIPQDYKNMALNDLIAQMLNGADNLAERYKDQPGGRRRTAVKTYELVDDCVQSLVTKAEPDYELYNTLSSRSQGALAAGGLDVKKFPHMNRADRGRALESQLGM